MCRGWIEHFLLLSHAAVGGQVAILFGVRAEYDVVARRARNSVASERAIGCIGRRRITAWIRNCFGDVALELPAIAIALSVERVLPLAHDAVTLKTSVLDQRGLFGMELLFAFKLSKEDWI